MHHHHPGESPKATTAPTSWKRLGDTFPRWIALPNRYRATSPINPALPANSHSLLKIEVANWEMAQNPLQMLLVAA